MKEHTVCEMMVFVVVVVVVVVVYFYVSLAMTG